MFSFRSLCRERKRRRLALSLTPEHSVNYVRSMFLWRGIMVRAVAEEALALASVSLFLAMVAIWVQVLGVI